MDKKVLKLMTIGFSMVTVFTFILIISERGLPDYVKRNYRLQKEKAIKVTTETSGKISNIKKSLEVEKSYLEPISLRDNWQARISKARKLLDRIDKFLKKGETLYEKNEKEGAIPLQVIINSIHSENEDAAKLIFPVEKKLYRLLEYKRDTDGIISQTRANYKYILTYPPLSKLEAKIIKAKADWPNKAEDLNARRKTFSEFKAQTKKDWVVFEAEMKKINSGKNPDYERFGLAADAIKEKVESMSKVYSHIDSLIDQLYYSQDKILVDMNSYSSRGKIQYLHVYNLIKIDQNKKSTTEKKYQNVTRAEYDKHKKNIGMVVATKDLGLYDFEAKKYTAPPGYRYVGDKKYGNWRRDSSGNSFWVFYGQYAFMRSLFWGPSYYSPIYQRNYNTYTDYRRRGRTYYGRSATGTQRYGSDGTFTRGRYSSSSYVTKKYRTTRSFSGRSYRGRSYSGSRFGSGK